MKIHVTVLVIKCVEGNNFANTAQHTRTDLIPQQPSPDSQNQNFHKSQIAISLSKMWL